MSHTEVDWLARYQPWRRHVEVGFWVVVLLAEAVFNSGVLWLELQRTPGRAAPWELLAWELTSVVGVGLLIPFIAAFARRYPLHLATLPRHLGWHLGASVVFSVAHVAIMVALRKALYAALGRDYGFDWPAGLTYEYLKDVRTYLLIVVTLLGYRLLLLRVQGEARVLDAPDTPAGTSPTAPLLRPERFLVRKLRREFLVAATDIAWLQAQGNYVGLHVNGHDYLLRSTLADFMAQLDPTRFARVHRSYVVNLDQVAEIESLDGGEARLRMKDGSQVPCSRRHRSALGGPVGTPGADQAASL